LLEPTIIEVQIPTLRCTNSALVPKIEKVKRDTLSKRKRFKLAMKTTLDGSQKTIADDT